MRQPSHFSLEGNLGRYIDNIWTGNDALYCDDIKIIVGVFIRSKRSYSYSEIRSVERTLKL